MNFKSIYLIFLFALGCGVKGPPTADEESRIKSWPQSIIDEYEEETAQKKSKKNSSKK